MPVISSLHTCTAEWNHYEPDLMKSGGQQFMRSIARQRILYCMKHRHQVWLQVLQHHTRCQAAQWLLVSLKR